ncbi:flavin-containing monooxygenase [Zavarzinia compransoris]|uniref:FAD-containing monooxygenase EthA n=1 Tax=Zavarzinia compransoris TaxID=1264899 RepID=A0A317E7F5_9PROT|nr:NAD(P)/FAD-dependent oxidoreductase [Zavarzinia compransoris]PWR21025.1 FAD-containing monooxygenase EthA [Zavarzinia compransoris]TDP44057.1 cation diffusion facilitator CzcD-associated flavoprotein CzcO [Zavarzinia compransoris]
MPTEHLDVLIVGAGLSGIGAAYHLQAHCPGKSFALLESRERLGGTWDLFRYPGIRSDSDMYTLGYSFKPWTDAKAIADGPSILRYMTGVAKDNHIAERIRYGLKVKAASWSTKDAAWTVEAERTATGETVRLTCNFLYSCSGYYNYEAGFTPDFPGRDAFKGTFIHPQHWPEGLDYAGKKVVVIGSGATAVTLVPEMAKTAGHVTMLQRSPTYVITRPGEDKLANNLRKWLPAQLAYGITRWKNVGLGMMFFQLSRSRPEKVKQKIIDLIRRQVGPNFDVEKHFTPTYKPWDQRVCLVPDGDLFKALRKGSASVVTDHIETFTETGIRLKSGQEIEADIIVSATGLKLLFMGGMSLSVDGKAIDNSALYNYRGMMYSDLPNLVTAFGYTNASWTLKADLTAERVCRLLNHMDRHGFRYCVPRLNDPTVTAEPFIDFSSGYVQRALQDFPRQGSKRPWKLYQNYALDILSLRYGKLDDGTLEFGGKPAGATLGAVPKQA